MAASTWTWNGGFGFSTTAADWTLTSGAGNANDYPQPGDTVIVPGGVIQDGLGEMLGQGFVTVEADAEILATAAGDGINLGTTGGTSGTLTVTGTGALLDVGSATNGIVIGNAGTGVLNVENASGVIDDTNLALGGTPDAPGGGVGTLALTGGSSAELLSGLALWGSSTISVDATSGIDLGSSNTYTPGAVVVEAGQTLIGTGTVFGNVVNDGTIDASNNATPASSTGGTLEVTGNLSGTGSVFIGTDTTLKLDGSASAGETFNFSIAGATLTLNNPGSGFSAPLTNLNTGDKIDFNFGPGVLITSVVTIGNTVTVTTPTGSYVLNNVSFAGGANTNFSFGFDSGDNLPSIQLDLPQVTWTGASGIDPTDFATGANWQGGVAPNSTQQANFNDSNGGTVTGTGTAIDANFFNSTGTWLLSNINLTIAGQSNSPYPPYAMNDNGFMTISGGTLTGAGSDDVDSYTGAALTAEGGAEVSFQGTALGNQPGKSGSLLLTGAGTTWRNVASSSPIYTGGYMLVGYEGAQPGGQSGAAGHLTITDDAALIDTFSDRIGVNPGSEGDVTVSAGGTWTDGALNVAESGVGSLLITGGTVTTNGFSALGLNAGSSGSVTINSGGIWNAQMLSIGHSGAGTLIVSGGTLTGTAFGTVGSDTGSTGTATINSGGVWNTQGLNIGNLGSGTLTVSTGMISTTAFLLGAQSGGAGVASLTNGTITASTGMQIGETGSGTMTVGAGGSLLFGGTFNPVGANAGGNGVLQIVNGGIVEATQPAGNATVLQIANSGTFGTVPASTGSVLVSGTGSLLNLNGNGMSVGNSGIGSLTVAQGATVDAGVTNSNLGGALDAGFNPGSEAEITVTGSQSVLNLVGFTGLGQAGSASLTVSNSGAVNITNSPTNAGGAELGTGFFGSETNTGGEGEATVTSSGSLGVQSTLIIGGAGASGLMNVNNGGVVTIGTGLFVGEANALNGTIYGATGSLNIGAGGTVMVTEAPQLSNFAVQIGLANSDVGGPTGLANGAVTVSGAGALLNTNDNPLQIGVSADGNLTVSHGGSVSAGTENSGSSVAMGIGREGVGSLLLTDPGSRVTTTGAMFVGRAGNGNLVVENHASLVTALDPTGSGNIIIGDATGSSASTQTSVQTGGTGNAEVTSDGDLYSQQDILVGEWGTSGDLSVNDGGTVEAATAVDIGLSETIAAGGSIVTNAGTAITSAATLLAGQGVVTVGAGGLLKVDGVGLTNANTSDVVVGAGLGASGVLNVTGAGATVNSEGYRIGIGSAGPGSLLINQGGTVLAGIQLPGNEAIYVGGSAGATGQVTVSDPGSELLATGQFSVGLSGQGSLLIENQGTVTTGNSVIDPAEGVDIAQNDGASGTVTVTGTKSLLSNTGRFVVGDAGVGSLSIAAGATAATALGTSGLAGLTIANTTSASGSSVNVSGAGSDLAVTGTLIVGSSGYGSLSLSQGATATASSLDVAAASSGDGAISIAGSGTTLDIAGSLTLGDQAAGELSILGGAQMTIAGGEIGGTGIDGTGNLDIEDAGSTLTINGGTLLVGANGPAEFTLGIGGTLDGEVSTEPNGVTNLYGNVDPATLLNDGAENIGNSQGGTSQSDDFYIANSGTITIKGTATFYTPLVTFETAAADGSTTGLWVIAAKDTLVMNAASADASQTFDFTSATAAELVIGQVPSGPNINNLDTMVQNGTTMTTPLLTNSPVLGASALLNGGWAAPIENYQVGDTIVLQGLTYGSASASGDVVTVWSGEPNVSNALGSLVFVDKSGSTTSAASLAEAAAAAAQITPLPCFAAGTRIATADGLVKVERLAVGDRVRTVLGGVGSAGSGRDWVQGDAERAGLGGPGRGEARADQYEPIVWVGSRAVNCVRHPKPETVWPVRVRAGAFGDGMPVRDLWLSPDHAVYVDGVLVPVKLLVNGTSIAQVKRNHVVYYHVELPEHAVILAEGLTVESYLDTGDRTNFVQNGETIRLFPDFAARLRPAAATTWETKGAAPLVMAGPELRAARQVVAALSSRQRPGVTQPTRHSPQAG